MKGKHEKRNKNFLLILSRSKKKTLWQIGSFPMYFSKLKRNYEPEFAKEIIKQKPNLVKMQL